MSPELESIIQRSLDTIEAHLADPLTPEALSREAGFSLYHYCRVFKAAVGMSVMRHITRRRLLHAAYQMGQGQEMTEAALAFGFDSYAGFYKAFRREFGTSPTEHLKNHQAGRPARPNLKERGNIMERKAIETVLAQWNLTGCTIEAVCYPNTGHLSDHTYLINGRYYLKCSESYGSLDRQAELLGMLHAEGLAAAVVPTKAGAPVAQEGAWQCLLTEKLDGHPLWAVDALLHPETGRAIGGGLARLHEVLLQVDPVLCTEENLLDTLRGWAIPKAREAMALDTGWLDSYLERFAALYPALPVQIIHRDPNPDNLILSEGKLTGFLDFDLSRIAPRIFDLAYAATGILSVAFSRVEAAQQLGFFPLAKAIWQGYHTVSPLAREEWEALPDMVIALQLICVAAFAGTDTHAQLAQVNQQMLRMMLENESLLREAAEGQGLCS